MEAWCKKVYRQMQQEMRQCRKAHDCIEQQVVHSFSAACRHWQVLAAGLRSFSFSSDAQEIRFFRTVKPAFTSEMEYYSLLYHAILFAPPRGEAALDFWTRECRRLENFVKGHGNFVRCFGDEGSSLAPYYFLRRYAEAHHSHHAFSTMEVMTNGDLPAARYHALRRYRMFALEQRSKVRSP